MERFINLRHVTTREAPDDVSLIVEEKSDSVSFEKRSVPDPVKVDVAFDKSLGILSFITDYGIFQASGFLTQDSLGTGKQGRRGRRGRDGPRGKDGFEGRTGKPGCAGPQGNPGIDGEPGLDGEDGPMGALGQIGCPGDKGPTGPMGPTGPTGPEGARGSPGLSCLIGPTGDIGPTPIEHVVISTTEPTDPLVYLWGQPVSGVDEPDPELPVDPGTVEPLNATLASRSITMQPGSDGFYMGIASFAPQNISGGRGPFVYRWSGDFESDGEVNPFETGTTAQNINLRARTTIPSGQTKTLTGNIVLQITDQGDNNRVLTLQATYTFRATNSATNPLPPGGGGGCIVYGMQVELSPNRAINIEHVHPGDVLVGLEIDGLPDTSYGDDSVHLDWYTINLNAVDTEVTVNHRKTAIYKQYYHINNELKITIEETLLGKRGDVWSFIRVADLRVGDVLYHKTGDRPVTSIEVVDEEVRTVTLNVETSDTFYVQGYLAHNRDSPGFDIKR